MTGSRLRYTAVAIVLHWTMAFGIGALAVLGLVMAHVKLTPQHLFQLYQLHKSIGVTVLLAAVLRLGWRITHRPPPLPAAMSAWEQIAARATHALFYAALFGVPTLGWALVSSSVFNLPTVLYGVIPWPDLPVLSTLADKGPVEAVFKVAHAYGAYALIALVLVHAAAALRHHFVMKDDVLVRMVPALGLRQPSTSNARPGDSIQ